MSVLTSTDYAAIEKYVKKDQQKSQEAQAEQMADVQKAGKSSNPFEDRVQHTAMQGYTLFMMPFVTPKYDAFPREICDLTHLNHIQLSNNNLKAIPKEIGQLKNLKVLSLQSNKITSLPPEIGDLENLEKLNLAKNQLTVLPDEIGKLKKLKVLNLKKNMIPKSEVKKIKAKLPKCKIKM